jgi:hypothetical protein
MADRESRVRRSLRLLRRRLAFWDPSRTGGRPEDNVDAMTTALGADADNVGGFGDSLAPTNWVPSQQDDRPRH